MGLTDLGNPLTHEDTMKWSKHVKDQGIEQFVNLYNRQKQRQNDPFKWGDETEYTLVKFEDGPKEAKVSLTSCFVLIQINRKNGVKEKFGFWTPEYAAYMLEATPASPYEALNFIAVENNMKNRKKEISECLKNGEEVLCITAFPRLGCEKFTYPETIPTPGEGYTKSLFFADEALFPHPRYKNTTKNVIGRRGGQKAVYNLPIYKDKNTQSIVDESHKLEVQASPHHIYMDTMGFGSGYSCFQVTVQGANIEETKIIYDQWAPFCPIMMALVAAAPFHRGFIADCDTRWKISCNTHDCRTQEEQVNLPKSRFASINYYLTEQGDALNDNPDVFRQEDYQKLIDGGVDKRLAKHVAYLFLRSTISMFKHNTVDQDNTTQTGHFENVHSTNWQSLRFKPPPADGSIGWRVEFRPCDLQTTDFENAAVACFLILLTRIALDYKLNFLIPISKVDENVERAQVPNAVLDKKFWFRKNVDGTQKGAMVNGNASNNEFVEMSMDEIINGKKGGFPGVLSYMRQYVAEQNLEDNNRKRIHQYLRLIEGRASGKILTTAAWMRKFVNEHPDYRHDSIITEKINYDLLKAMQEIQNGTRHCPELLGEDYTMLA